MALTTKKQKIAGRMAVQFQDDGICVAFMKRLASGSLAVDRVAFYSTEPSDSLPVKLLLDKLAKDLNGARYLCSHLLAAREYQLLLVDAPNVPADELKTAMRWRLKDMLDFHIDDATIDVLDVPSDKQAAAAAHSMYAVAARNQIIEKCQGLFEQAKIPLSAIDIPEMAQRNFSALLEPAGRGLAMLSFDSYGGLLTVTYSGELYLARRIDITLTQLQQADVDQINACYERITLELQRSFDHFDRQYRFIAVSKLMLSPLGKAGSDLKEHLSSNLYLPVEEFDLSAVLDISRAPELQQPGEQQRFFLTLGAALRHEEVLL